MINPLTLEEKVAATKLIEHDAVEALIELGNAASASVRMDGTLAHHLKLHIRDVLASITILTTYTNNCNFLPVKPDDVEYIGARLLTMNTVHRPGNITFSSHIEEGFNSLSPLLYTALHNFVNNGLGGRRDHRVNVSVAPFCGMPAPIFNPEDAKARGYFIRFAVQDDGPGFPTDRPLTDFLKLGVSSRGSGHGFGLYYATLVCKFLRAPLSIRSEPGNTQIEIYHPVTLTN